MAIVATGGYGRGLLAPGSDIDLLVPAALQADAVGRERRRIHALHALGSGLQGRARDAHRRTVPEARLADITIRTALLDSRLILGDTQLFADFEHRFRSDVVAGTARPIHRRQDGRARRPPTRRAAKAATRSSPTSRTAKAACAICIRCIGCRNTSSTRTSAPRPSKPASSRRKRCKPSAAARTFSGRVRCFLHFVRRARRRGAVLRRAAAAMAQSLGYNLARWAARGRALHEALLPRSPRTSAT